MNKPAIAFAWIFYPHVGVMSGLLSRFSDAGVQLVFVHPNVHTRLVPAHQNVSPNLRIFFVIVDQGPFFHLDVLSAAPSPAGFAALEKS